MRNEPNAAASSALTAETIRNQRMFANDISTLTHPPFSGDKSEDAAQWLRVFERRSKRVELSDPEMVESAVCLLEGAAELWYTGEVSRGKISPEASWARWKNAFTNKYVEVESTMELLERLLHIQQGESETIEEYETRIKDLARMVGSDVTASTVLVVFKKGLLSHFRVELEKSEYRTLDEALAIVVRHEKWRKIERESMLRDDSESDLNVDEDVDVDISEDDNDNDEVVISDDEAKEKLTFTWLI